MTTLQTIYSATCYAWVTSLALSHLFVWEFLRERLSYFQMRWEFNLYILNYNMIPCWNIMAFLYIIRAYLVVPWVSNDTIHNFIAPYTYAWPHFKPFIVIVAIPELPHLRIYIVAFVCSSLFQIWMEPFNSTGQPNRP